MPSHVFRAHPRDSQEGPENGILLSSPAQVFSVKPGLTLLLCVKDSFCDIILSGVSLATQIFDNPFRHARAHSSTAAPVQHRASSDFTDPKRLLYRALMLRGMGCRPAESLSFPPCQQSALQPEICEKAREIVLQVISGSSIDSVSSIDRTLQHLALEQVNTSRQIVRKSRRVLTLNSTG